MGLVLLTPPATEPLSLVDAKLHLRVTASDTTDDSLITALIAAARRNVEERTRRSLVTQTWQLTRDQFPTPSAGTGNWAPLDAGIPRIPPGNPSSSDLRRTWYSIKLIRGPVQSVSSVQYLDTAGASQTMLSTAYEVDITDVCGRIVPLNGTQWPSTIVKLNAVTVTYVAGYGAAAAVPGDLVAALKLILGDLYENREAAFVGNYQVSENRAVESLLGPYELPEAG